MIAVISLVVVVTLSVIVVRIGTVALTMTGVSTDLARFQALSAFTGAGFTTQESESVVTHPVRRRIIMALLRLGNAGIVSAVATLVLSFVQVRQEREAVHRVLLLFGALLLLWLFARSRSIERWMSRVIEHAMRRWTRLEVQDYVTLLRLEAGYGVREMAVEAGDWLADRTLRELQLNREGVNVIGVRREDGSYVGSPTGDTRIRPGDLILVYGRLDALEELDTRRHGKAGDRRHQIAIEEQDEEMRRQERQEALSQQRAADRKGAEDTTGMKQEAKR